MGSMNRLSILLVLSLCVNLSSARKFFYEHHAHHSTLHPFVSVTLREPDPEQPDGHRSEWATMWSSGQVIAEEPPLQDIDSKVPPKGGSDPQDFDSVVLVAEPDHLPQKGSHPHGFGSVAYSVGSEPDPDE